jgi:prevent-host-death family protein
MAEDIVNVSTAKAEWSRLLPRVERGERMVITRAGQPVAELAPLTSGRRPRTPGMDRDTVVIHDDFDDPLPEYEAYS